MGKIEVTPCEIKGLYIIRPKVFEDERGYFGRSEEHTSELQSLSC